MAVIQSVLKEELSNSLRMLRRYQRELAALPKGSPVRKRIKNRDYLYVAFRKDGRFNLEYKGPWSEKAIEPYKVYRKKRSKYRGLLMELKKQILFLKRALHERKRRPVRAGR